MGCPIRCRGTPEINLQKGLSTGWRLAAGGEIATGCEHQQLARSRPPAAAPPAPRKHAAFDAAPAGLASGFGGTSGALGEGIAGKSAEENDT
jgi:hypothetical protein